MFRSIFPSFEKPVARPRYLHIEHGGRSFRGIGIVFLLAAVCGAAFALWDPSHQVTTPFVTASSSPATAAAKTAETTAAAPEAVEEPAAPTVKLSTLCSQRATARRDCASVKAFKDARLNAPDPVPAAKDSKSEVVAAKTSSPIEPSAVSEPTVETPATVQSEVPVALETRTATAPAPKVKRPRAAEEAPVERLVKVYDQVLPDGRRVPVYRRVGTGSLETGSIVDGEYRPARRANLDKPSGYFGLQ